MEIGALSAAQGTQSAMGQLVSKVLDQAADLIQQQSVAVAQQNIEAAAKAVDSSLGNLIDVVA